MNTKELKILKNIVYSAIEDGFEFDQDDGDSCVIKLVSKYGAEYGYFDTTVDFQDVCQLTNTEYWYIAGYSYFDGLEHMAIPSLARVLDLPQPNSFEIEDVLIRIDNLIELQCKRNKKVSNG